MKINWRHWINNHEACIRDLRRDVQNLEKNVAELKQSLALTDALVSSQQKLLIGRELKEETTILPAARDFSIAWPDGVRIAASIRCTHEVYGNDKNLLVTIPPNKAYWVTVVYASNFRPVFNFREF